MARRRRRKGARRFVAPAPRRVTGGGISSWVNESFAIALILGDFFFGERLVESFERFSDGGLTGLGDPFAWMMLAGIVGWWLVVLAWGWVGQGPGISAGVLMSAFIASLVPTVLSIDALGSVWPVFSLGDDGEEVAWVGWTFSTILLLALFGFQLWRLEFAFGSRDEDEDEVEGSGAEATSSADEGDTEVPERVPNGSSKGPPNVAPGIRLAAALCLLPAGWALLAPGDFIAVEAQRNIPQQEQGVLEQLGAGALASVFSAGIGMLFGYGPRALASCVLGERPSGVRFFAALWAAHFLRLVLNWIPE